MASQGDRIHNAILAAIKAGTFRPVSFDPDTGERITATTGSEQPATIKIRPEVSTFEEAVGLRTRGRVQERVSWDWRVDVRWNNQVSLDEWEENWLDEALLLPRTVDFNQQVTILLTRTEYTHPPEHASSSGTRAEMTFSAILSRK